MFHLIFFTIVSIIAIGFFVYWASDTNEWLVIIVGPIVFAFVCGFLYKYVEAFLAVLVILKKGLEN